MKSTRNKIAILFFLFSVAGMAQVGVGTSAPAATLDVTAANLTGTTVDGLLVPRVSRLRAQTMTGTPTSTLIFVNDVSNGTATGTTVNVTAAGFYFFNGTVWERLASGANNAWAITGNAGLSGTTNFLGTTDNVDLAFRRNNTASGKIGATSTGFGVNALNAGINTTNAAFGTNALASSTGNDNVAVGNGTLSAVITGAQNTGVGNAALAIATGSANTAIGFQASTGLTNASNTTAVGYQALSRNTAGDNTGFGFQAMGNNTSGSGNTALGFQALTLNATGSQNTSVGYQAARATTGGSNTAVGYQPLFFNTSGVNITAIGRHALHNNTASNNTAVGQQALLSNTGATGNTAVGSDALRISTGAANTAMGWAAGDEHGSGANNTFIGSESGRYSTGASNHNTFLGYQSGYRSTGNYNTALGANTLKPNAASSNNVAVGYNALLNTNSNNNTAVGYGALSGNSIGTGNVAIGYNAGALETTDNKLYIENSNANENGALIYGDFNANIARINGQVQVGNPAVAGYALPTVRGTNGQILQTNGAGATSWVTNPATALSVVRATLSAPQALTDAGWQKLNFNGEAFDTANEFNPATGRFTASKAGFYRIDAAIHTNDQANGQFYSVGIRVNGALYQQTSSNHISNGPVERAVSCLVQLAVNDYVEVFVENWQTGVNIDNYTGKTIFEIQQIR